MPTPDKARRKEMARLIEQAHAGKQPWLDTLIQRSGYIHSLERLHAKHIAYIFGVSIQMVSKWVKNYTCPHVQNHEKRPAHFFDGRAVREWREDEDDQARSPRVKEGLDDVLRLQKAAADIKEIQRDKIRGELVPRKEAQDSEIRNALIFKQSVLGLPRQVAPQLFGQKIAKIENLLKKKVENIIRALSGEKASKR